MKILSIDPGYAIFGFSIIEADLKSYSTDLLSYGTITTSKGNFESRLLEIARSFSSLIDKYKPDEISIEQIYFIRNITTGIHVAEIRGAIIYICTSNNIPIYQYTPLEIKLAITSYGKATKKQVQQMVQRFFSLKDIPKPDDAADAIACGITHLIKHYNIPF
ncbi:MAG: crossover junction endodeoxyribonuclease RuvC [Spirochaetes bacterium]|nr:crossover junction endodeoxyribonuclease RuvC [Spirochaetota bacterium]NLJ04706.1 crossover junction endodeoxyribonuclease RuvC [Exilispira sp.]MBP8990490.1 crossover junction endodeoxyribonuclease RuvC [Spirochaetota bacterium]HOV45516.1 crossover junction endodeoxyribonuclease RuvC [Exilispira sp.]HPO61117.1 crossover junction endodeoxyribonuclease RuvC [Exilispira sp.]